MVSTEYQDVSWAVSAYYVKILVDRICGAFVPTFVNPLGRGEDFHEFAELGLESGPASIDVPN
jgi:hypothetical protein